MAEMKRNMALLVSQTAQQPAAAVSAPQQPPVAPAAPAAATAKANASYAAKAARAPRPGTNVPPVAAPAPKPVPTNARARHHPGRLILSVRATPELTAHVRDNASLLRNQVNSVLEKHKSKAGIPLRINSVDTTASGNVVVVAADKLTSADLVEHSEAIASAILPDSSLYIKGERDEPWYQVLVNGVSTRVHDIDGLPSGLEILADLTEWNDHKYDWATQPRWLGSAAELATKKKGSLILAFHSEADARHAIEHSVSVFGQLCSARRFEDAPRVRICDNCCGFDHTARICEKPKRCGVCGSNEHTTVNHSCDGMECDFYSPSHSHTPGTHCEHTKLKCPHCGGEHVVRSPQCKIWERRRNALRKPKHNVAKTGAAPKQVRPKSRAATKEAAKASKEQGADDTTGDEAEAAAAKAKKRKDKGKDKETA